MELKEVKQQCLLKLKEGREFEEIFSFADSLCSELVKNRGFYHSLAEAFAKKGKLEESKKCYEKLIETWPNDCWGAKRRLKALRTGISRIEDNQFSIDSDVFSDFMKLKLAGGQYETEELNILRKCLESTDSVMELVSGVGFLGINSKKIEPSINYYGYEANPYLTEIIKKNQTLNETFFEIENAVLNDYSGETNFYITQDFWASSLVKPKNYQKEVSVKVLDINSEIKDRNINFIIMDIEGGEVELIPKIDFKPIQKILLEIHPNVIGDDGVSRVFSSLIKSGLKYDMRMTRGHVAYFYR